MFRESINGLDELLQDDIPRNSVILVSGAEGTLKSSLVSNIISNYLIGNNEHGLYITLDEDKESLLRNMVSVGIKKIDRLHIFDYKDIRLEWRFQEPEMIEVTNDAIDFYREKYDKLTVFAFDSLNALYSLSNQANLRRNIYHFFTMLKDKELTSFLIMEAGLSEGLVYANDYPGCSEYFLADGIIEVGIVEARENVKRYIQVRKMRATRHTMNKHQLIVDEEGLAILGSVY